VESLCIRIREKKISCNEDKSNRRRIEKVKLRLYLVSGNTIPAINVTFRQGVCNEGSPERRTKIKRGEIIKVEIRPDM